MSDETAAATGMGASHHHPAPTSFIWKYIFSTDHKVIAKQYLFNGLFFLLLAGIFALLIRWQLAYPFEPIPLVGGLFSDDGAMLPEHYTKLFTNHGALMIFFAITPIVIGAFGNFAIPLQIGAPDMAFPRLNMYSYWVLFTGSVIMIVSWFVPGGAADSGWTAYAPLSSSPEATLGWGQTLWALGIIAAGTSSLMGGINYVTTTLNLRSPGMTLMRMPQTIWGLFCTSVLNVLWVPVVAAAMFMIILDRVAGTSFFVAGPLAPNDGGQALLYQHLFWGFGHPEVYILIFPVWGLMGDLLSVFSRKPAFAYKSTVICMIAIVIQSMTVYGHHMFTAGINPLLGRAFMIMTIFISIPTAVFFLNWLGTIWRGSLRLTPPMLFSLSIIFVFGIGGLTGLFNAAQALDVYLHDTYFVVGHFHYVLAAGVFLGSFAGIYYWFPKMFGRQMNQTLGKIHFWLSFVFFNFVFFPMFLMGMGGHMRRIADPSLYEFLQPFQNWNIHMGWSAIALGAAQLLFIYNFIHSFFWGPKASENPWDAATLEWTLPSPPPHYNFEEIPTVYRGPYEYNPPYLIKNGVSINGRDWIGQHEPEPAAGSA